MVERRVLSTLFVLMVSAKLQATVAPERIWTRHGSTGENPVTIANFLTSPNLFVRFGKPQTALAGAYASWSDCTFTVNDPTDKWGLDVCGFDTSVPNVVTDFIRGAPVQAEQPEEEAVAD
jgi:hypothetical protein